MLLFHKKRNADLTVAVHESDHPHDSTIVKIDKDGKYLEMIQKPGDSWPKYGNLTQTSLYLMKKDILKFIQKSKNQDFETDIFPEMLKKKKNIFGYLTMEFTKDMGTPQRYTKLKNKLQSESLG
jgi:NDP-sugar pyrophosphorylase family protein